MSIQQRTPVEEVVLHPNDGPVLAFQGCVVAQAVGPQDDPSLRGRHHAITVYETERGELHLAIEYRTCCQHESSHCTVEAGILVDEIPDVLTMYEATEHVNRRELADRHENAQRRLVKKVYNQYDDLCVEIGKQLIGYEPRWVDEREHQATGSGSQPRWKGFLRFRPR